MTDSPDDFMRGVMAWATKVKWRSGPESLLNRADQCARNPASVIDAAYVTLLCGDMRFDGRVRRVVQGGFEWVDPDTFGDKEAEMLNNNQDTDQ